jgi:hypothetical protein
VRETEREKDGMGVLARSGEEGEYLDKKIVLHVSVM